MFLCPLAEKDSLANYNTLLIKIKINKKFETDPKNVTVKKVVIFVKRGKFKASK